MSEGPRTTLAFEARVLIGPPERLGETAAGRQQFIPILGGTFHGTGLKGEVIPGGADWQTVRPDGVTLVEAIYALRTQDGAVINVRNLGIAAPRGDGTRYVRTTPRFEAPVGPYDWLNKTIFVGTIDLSPEPPLAVLIRVFKVL